MTKTRWCTFLTHGVNVLGANLAILGCPLLSQSLGYTFIELVMIENSEFDVEILTLSFTVPEIITSGFGGDFWLSLT